MSKNLDSVLKKDLRRRLDSLVLIPNQDKELEVVKEPTRPILTSTPSTSPTNPPPLPPRRSQSSLAPPLPPRTRSCSLSCSDVSSIQGEVFTDSEVFSPRKGREAITSSNTRQCLASRVDLPAPSSQNCSGNTLIPVTDTKIIATMDWREDEKAVVEKCMELQTEIEIYTPDDIDGHYNEEDFYKKLGAIQQSYREAKKSINNLLVDYDDVLPTQRKEYWKGKITENLQQMKSHERQLRAALTRVKGNISASVSNASASGESTASELTRAKRKEALSKMKTNEESIEKDVSKLEDKIYCVKDWTLEDDVSIGRGLKMAEKWDKDLEKIVQMMRELKTLQREHDVEETEIKVEELEKRVEELEEDVEEVKKKITKEDNERELYSLDKTKVNKVELPTFAGKDHEDFSKFKEDIEKRFKTNRTSRDEQIIKLRECLKGHARKLVPDSNVTEIKEAWSILKQAFGNPIKIINQRKEALMKLGVKPRGTANLNTEIAWYIDITTFLRELIDLGVKNPEYRELIFTNNFAMEIRALFPFGKVRDKLRKCQGQGQSHLENMLELIKEWLETAQINQQENDVVSKSALAPSRYQSSSSSKLAGNSAAHFSGTSSLIPEDSDNEDEGFDNVELPMFVAFKPPRRNEECRICRQLENDGDTRNLYDDHIHSYPSGCPRYIQMTLKERYQICKRAKICMNCHDPDYIFKNYDSRNHDCPAKSGRKGRYSCTKCDLHLWVCETHQEENQEALEKFREKYKKDFNLNFGLVVTGSVFGHMSPGKTPLSLNMSKSKSRKDPSKEISSPQSISTGEATRMLQRKLSDSGEKTELRPIPPGRAQFMIGQTRGKTGPLNILYDSGCYALLLREGVQAELGVSVLKTKGPFTVNGVGNTSVRVNDEWQTSLPLIDGSRQIVEGWTVDEVTAPLPRIDLTRAVKELKNDDKDNTKLQNMFVELVTGGQVDILLGQMYNAIFPIHVHSLPSGLTIYELQVASHDSQVNSVIGGPHESFEHIAQQVGGAGFVLAHLMQSLKTFKDLGPPPLSKSIMSFSDEVFAIKNNSDMDDFTEDLCDQENLKDQLLDTPKPSAEDDDQLNIQETDDQLSVQENDDQLNVQEDDDQYNPVRENDDQCQIAEQVNWVGAITSSNTRQCLDTSQTLSKENDDHQNTKESEDIVLDNKEQNTEQLMVCTNCGENADADVLRNLHLPTDDDNESTKT